MLAVDYRLAPEHPYPAGLHDVLRVIRGLPALLEILGRTDMPRVSLVGDSGGAALCASAAHRLSLDASVRVDSQVLIYPSLDYTLSMPSVDCLARGFLLERERVEWYFDQYFQSDEDRRAVSPLFMDCTGHLPRTLVITAEYCPLRDEGEAYVDRLAQVGVGTRSLLLYGAIHACLNLEDLLPESCDATYTAIGSFLNDA